MLLLLLSLPPWSVWKSIFCARGVLAKVFPVPQIVLQDMHNLVGDSGDKVSTSPLRLAHPATYLARARPICTRYRGEYPL